jgi:hypothetical protein
MLIFIHNCIVGSWYLIVVVLLTNDYWHHHGHDSYSCPIYQSIQAPHIALCKIRTTVQCIRKYYIHYSKLSGLGQFDTPTGSSINRLTPELNPSAQRCLTRFLYWGLCFLNRAFR